MADDNKKKRTPKSEREPEYPYNQVTQSLGGHEIHWDSTPGKENHVVFHPGGTYTEIDANGRKNTVVSAEQYHSVSKGSTSSIEADHDHLVIGSGRHNTWGGHQHEVAQDFALGMHGQYLMAAKENMFRYCNGQTEHCSDGGHFNDHAQQQGSGGDNHEHSEGDRVWTAGGNYYGMVKGESGHYAQGNWDTQTDKKARIYSKQSMLAKSDDTITTHSAQDTSILSQANILKEAQQSISIIAGQTVSVSHNQKQQLRRGAGISGMINLQGVMGIAMRAMGATGITGNSPTGPIQMTGPMQTIMQIAQSGNFSAMLSSGTALKLIESTGILKGTSSGVVQGGGISLNVGPSGIGIGGMMGSIMSMLGGIGGGGGGGGGGGSAGAGSGGSTTSAMGMSSGPAGYSQPFAANTMYVYSNTIWVSNASTYFPLNQHVYYSVPAGDIAVYPLTTNTYYVVCHSNSTGLQLASISSPTVPINLIAASDDPGEKHTLSYITDNSSGGLNLANNGATFTSLNSSGVVVANTNMGSNGAIKTTANTIVLNANTIITLMVGNSSVTISANGINIQSSGNIEFISAANVDITASNTNIYCSNGTLIQSF